MAIGQEKKEIIMESDKTRVTVKLVGENGNVFNLLGVCIRAMTRVGLIKEANSLRLEVMSATSYDQALRIMSTYCDVE